MESDGTVAFEQALLSLRRDGHTHHRQMSLALPPYLQALMLAYSEELYADAERYSVLIDELLKLPTHILFVSLNYDTLLDSNLDAFARLQSIDDYVSGDRNWSLIKPHGSANWFIELDQPFDPTAPAETFVVPNRSIKSVPTQSHALYVARGLISPSDEHGMTQRYPAIALPEGPKDELVLPRAHLEHLRSALKSAWALDVMVLGYSALDTEVLELLGQSGARIRRMTVVNRDPESTLAVYTTIERYGIEAIWPDTFDGSYEDWIDGDGLRRWVEEFGGLKGVAYPSLTSPGDLEKRIATHKLEERRRRDADAATGS